MRGIVRLWQDVDVTDIEKHLLVVGELSAQCNFCHKIGIDPKLDNCPNCHAHFKYRGFRRKTEPHYLRRVREEHPSAILIDLDDFKRALGKDEARKLLDL